VPKQQVQLRSRGESGSDNTAGQRRAAAELERIRRDQQRVPTEAELAAASSTITTPSMSPRTSISGMPTEMSMEEIVTDVQKMKAIIRQHERRIRLLEDQLADRNMADAYGF